MSWLLGVAAAAAMPPVYIFPLLWIAFGGLYLLTGQAETGAKAFMRGWCFGLGFFMAGTYWISIALLTDAEKFAWLIPFALLGLSGAFAVYAGLACWLARHFRRQNPAANVLLFCLAWSAMEYARGHLLTGFPWNLLATAWGFWDAPLQIASVTGAYGLSFLTVLAASLPVLLWHDRRRYAVLLCAILGLSVLAIGWGEWRLRHAENMESDGIRLRLVQASIPQDLKWDPKQKIVNLQKHLHISGEKTAAPPTHILWAETSVPFTLNDSAPLRALLSRIVPENGFLITGALHAEGENEHWRIWNSIFALKKNGEIAAVYDKHHLVPFGEFVPLRALLPLDKITPGDTDFSRGPGPQTIALPGLPPFSPLICYEAIFPDEAVNRQHRPAWLLNVTNDAWYGVSSGPYQHLEAVRLRSIEQGLPLVRVANSGISALIDPYGRIVASLGLNETGALDVALPRPLTALTLYGRYGERVYAFMLVLAGLLISRHKRISIL